MTPVSEDSIARTARETIDHLRKFGAECDRECHFKQSIATYEKALRIAESIQDDDLTAEFRRLLGWALQGTGQFRSALATLAPLMQLRTTSGSAGTLYQAMTSFVGIAQSIPVPISVIQRAYHQTEQYLDDIGHPEWRDRLKLEESLLFNMKGDFPLAFEKAKEAWSMWTGEYPSRVEAIHLSQLFMTSLYTKQLDLARRYLRDMESSTTNADRYTEQLVNRHHSRLARLEGRPLDSVDWARRSVIAAKQVDDENYLCNSLQLAIRAFLCAGAINEARQPLRLLLNLRNSECGFIRYETWLLLGDYHLAHARHESGIAPADDEFGASFPVPDSILNKSETKIALDRAGRAFDGALKIGRALDELYQFNWRESVISHRLARIAGIRKRVE